MSLVYRAVWQDSRPALTNGAATAFSDWVVSKYPEVAVADNDQTPTDVNGASVTATGRRVAANGVEAYDGVMVEDRGHERWSTRLRSLATVSEGWLWVDVERVADDAFRPQDVVAPRLVRSLLDSSPDPSYGPARFSTAAKVVAPSRVTAEIVDLLQDPTRMTPLIVFAHHDEDDPSATVQRANAAANRLAGIVTVYVLSPEAQRAFDAAVPRDLSVWGGAARLYLPGDLAPARHRYLPARVVRQSKQEAGRRFGYMLRATATARRAPPLFAQVQSALRGGDHSTEELLVLADQEISKRDQTIEALRDQLETEENDRIDAWAEVEIWQQKNADLRRLLTRVIYERGESPDESQWTIPEGASCVGDAVAQAREHLTGIVIHDEACRDLDDLDRSVESTAWGQTTWVGLRALHAYQSEAAGFDGDFWIWCQRATNPDSWPATPKKLAMSESETVMKSERLSRQRLLPVDQAVNASGCISMESHLKISEGGGPMAPRVYFHDDTKGVTGKVHIGFIGPHRYMENTKTN